MAVTNHHPGWGDGFQLILTAVGVAVMRPGRAEEARRQGAPGQPLTCHADRVTPSQVDLPIVLVARYRAVDRETVGSALVDTPSHLTELTADIRQRGIVTPLRLGFNEEFGILDGNHRIAAAIRLGLQSVPVTLFRAPLYPRPQHAQPMLPADLLLLQEAEGERGHHDTPTVSDRFPRGGCHASANHGRSMPSHRVSQL